MQIAENISLKKFNSFGIEARARYFGSFSEEEELSSLLSQKPNIPLLVLGGGSNILLTQDFDGIVLKNERKGIDLVRENEKEVYLRVGAGENWHQFVQFCIQRNWAGAENLSLIPGNVGASPMQNIGAYGVELKDIFYELEAFDIRERRMVVFGLRDCGFGYRESVFKHQFKGQFIIFSVTYCLTKHPVFHTSYGVIEQELEKMGVQELSIQAISQAIIHIRSSKLPDPEKVGNAGSFFKNPVVPTSQYTQIKEQFPSLVGYPQGIGQVKLAAGWLIEQCGWKGFRKGDAGCYPKQALVLVNYGHATGKEIYNLSEEILQSVMKKFGVRLEREVNII